MPNQLNTGTEKSGPMERLEVSTSVKNSVETDNPYEPSKLFGLLPNVELIWLLSKDKASIEASSGGYDELPEGNYLIFRVSDELSIEKGLFQIPRPRDSRGRASKELPIVPR